MAAPAATCAPAALLRCEARASSSRSAAPAPAHLSARTLVSSRATFGTRRVAGVAARQAKLRVTAAVQVSADYKVPADYTLPEWGRFEMGMSPVYWEPALPKAGETMTLWFNPEMSNLKEHEYIAFNGGFNGPFMCGGAPRGMARKARGNGAPLWSIRINVPRHANFLEFGFTNGSNWNEGYKLDVKTIKEFEGKPAEFFQQGLTAEMGFDGACEAAIFPDSVPEAIRCVMPGGFGLAGQSCDLDIVAGCTDPDAPNYDPMATVDDSSCDLPPPPAN